MTYINKRFKAFAVPKQKLIIPIRSEARMKNYFSTTDARAWCDIVEERRQHILEYVAKNKEGFCIDKFIPLETIFNSMMVGKNAEIKKLRRQLKCLERCIVIYSKIKLTPEQQRQLVKLKSEIEKIYGKLDCLRNLTRACKKQINGECKIVKCKEEKAECNDSCNTTGSDIQKMRQCPRLLYKLCKDEKTNKDNPTLTCDKQICGQHTRVLSTNVKSECIASCSKTDNQPQKKSQRETMHKKLSRTSNKGCAHEESLARLCKSQICDECTGTASKDEKEECIDYCSKLGKGQQGTLHKKSPKSSNIGCIQEEIVKESLIELFKIEVCDECTSIEFKDQEEKCISLRNEPQKKCQLGILHKTLSKFSYKECAQEKINTECPSAFFNTQICEECTTIELKNEGEEEEDEEEVECIGLCSEICNEIQDECQQGILYKIFPSSSNKECLQEKAHKGTQVIISNSKRNRCIETDQMCECNECRNETRCTCTSTCVIGCEDKLIGTIDECDKFAILLDQLRCCDQAISCEIISPCLHEFETKLSHCLKSEILQTVNTLLNETDHLGINECEAAINTECIGEGELENENHVQPLKHIFRQSECVAKRISDELEKQYQEWNMIRGQQKTNEIYTEVEYCHEHNFKSIELFNVKDSVCSIDLDQELEEIESEKNKLKELVKQILTDTLSDCTMDYLKSDHMKLQKQLQKEMAYRKRLEKQLYNVINY